MIICDNDLSERCKFFNANYNAVYTYLQSQGRTQPIIDSSEKVCRFCGKRFPEVKFKQKAHAIPELIGNKEFVLYNECAELIEIMEKI